MSSAHYDTVDSLLLLLAEARERAESAARALVEAHGPTHIVDVLRITDQELNGLHARLFRGVFLPQLRPTDTQLSLDSG